MILGMSWRSILWQGAAVAVALYVGNTLAFQNATAARIYRRNGIRSVGGGNGTGTNGAVSV